MSIFVSPLVGRCLAVALMFGTPGTAVAGESETLTMRLLQTYCIDNTADPATVLAAAEKDGWGRIAIPEKRGSQTRAREIEGHHALLIVATDPNRALKDVSDHSCSVATSEAPVDVERDITRFADVRPIPGGPTELTFVYLERANGAHEAIDPDRLIRPNGLSEGEINSIRIVGVGPADNGVVVTYMAMSTK